MLDSLERWVYVKAQSLAYLISSSDLHREVLKGRNNGLSLHVSGAWVCPTTTEVDIITHCKARNTILWSILMDFVLGGLPGKVHPRRYTMAGKRARELPRHLFLGFVPPSVRAHAGTNRWRGRKPRWRFRKPLARVPESIGDPSSSYRLEDKRNALHAAVWSLQLYKDAASPSLVGDP
ncbi:hypothetical protein P154DRAFT_198558 [Amniculicola lignicola CBS 123094]|uniref:Uncharacterized protein n=1 Tax=Amniculicola lignicola CBS 123094 TaxID=1392246 RepID=A0A6A5WG33_9PLEO|nr:hypothetical protein P154DRAFT_198558 [Amniculicola lignicola CBS 123094]